MNSKVYVTQEANVDYSKAERFGEIVFLTSQDLVNIKGSLLNANLLRTLRRNLGKFEPSLDWIVISGSPYVSAAVFTILGRMGHTNLRLLRWGNREFDYSPVYLDFPARIEAEHE